MGDVSDFQRERIVSARVTGTSVNKTASLLDVSRAAVSRVMMAYTNHGETSSAKRNSSRKPKLSERDCRTLKIIVSKNHRTASVKMQQNSVFILKALFYKKSPTRSSQIQHPPQSCNC